MQEQLLNVSSQMLSCGRQLQDRRGNKTNPGEEVLKCPRCDSSNTKFCYYNNYSLAQPRHFCKNCKRYWTKGGTLRNVPVGGGCRRNKMAKQRSVDEASCPAQPEEGFFSSLLRDDPSNSNSSVQREFSVASSSDGLFVQDKDGDAGVEGLAFERLDHGTRPFSGGSVSVSISWAGQASSDHATLNSLQPFESGILGPLNLTGHHVKQETAGGLQTTDLSSIFDPQLSLIEQTRPPSLGDSIGNYNLCMEPFGLGAASSGDVQWRLPPSRLVSMVEVGHGYPNGRSSAQTIEDIRAESLRNFRKSALEEVHVHARAQVDISQGADCLPSDWQQSNPEGFFDGTGDGAYWSSGGKYWPQDDIYEDDQFK